MTYRRLCSLIVLGCLLGIFLHTAIRGLMFVAIWTVLVAQGAPEVADPAYFWQTALRNSYLPRETFMAVAVGIVATTLMMNDEKTKSQNFRLGLVGSAICSLLVLGYWLIFVSHSTLTSEAMLWAARLGLVPVVAWLGSAFRAEWLGKTEKWLS